MKHEITRADIMDMAEYAKVRKARKAEIMALKRKRRMEVGPFATFHFESFDTMWHQVHEMLFIERGGEAQIDDELIAYNPLIPNGSELVATIMFEIDDPVRRASALGRLGGVEETAFLRVAGKRIRGRAEADVDRTTAAGKASSVQFVHFPFTREQIAAFSTPGTEVVVGFDHAEYRHMAVMPEHVRVVLVEDFDR
ncbi:MAG: DUF3501 family protein [Alphaproteobacteria bacterium]